MALPGLPRRGLGAAAEGADQVTLPPRVGRWAAPAPPPDPDTVPTVDQIADALAAMDPETALRWIVATAAQIGSSRRLEDLAARIRARIVTED